MAVVPFPGLALDQVAVNKQDIVLPSPVSYGVGPDGGRLFRFGVLRIPAGNNHLLVRLAIQPQGLENGGRIRFRLEGAEPWREVGGEMRLSFRFSGKDQTQFLGIGNWNIGGLSQGWNGTVAKSEFQREVKELTVPEGGRRIDMSVVSGGNVDAVGILAIDEIRVTVIRNGIADPKPWIVANFTPDATGKQPRDWKNYMRADMGGLEEHPKGSGHPVLVLRDTSNTSYVEYNFQKTLDETIRPGDRLRIEWIWAYSIGAWQTYPISYAPIPPGEYLLRIQSVSPDGGVLREELSLPVSVPVEFYKRFWFVALCALGGAMLILSVPFWLYRRRVRARLDHLAWINRLEQERTRIARDIHDSIGSRLTQIRLMAARLRDGPSSVEEHDELVAGVLDEALDAGRNLHEIIWTVKTENDTAEALAGYLAQTAQSLCGAAGIQCRLKIPRVLPEIPLTSQIRHNVMLTVREALTNAIKHSRASEIVVTLRLLEGTLEIEVHDNGAGFAMADVRPGEGLGNMRVRMGEISGTVEWLSQAGQGTTVLIRLPFGRTP